MKTIKQVSEEIGVSKTAIRKHMTESFREQFAEIVSGVIHITEAGETLLKTKIHKDAPQTSGNHVSGNDSANQAETVFGVSALVSMLQTELEAKTKQLEAKDKQIADLTATIKLQAESINAERKNELASTIIDGQKLIEDGGTPLPKKSGFFRRFFAGSVIVDG